VTPAGWHPDPAGVPGRLRWWDGQTWTDHVHEQAPAAAAPPVAGSPLDASVLVVGPPRAATPGTRVFELSDGAGGRLGRLVETTRGGNDSAFGAALSRSRGWQHATTRELRGARGYPELVLAWGPSAPGLIVATTPDRREVGRLVLGGDGWAVLGIDGQPWGTVTPTGATGTDGRPLSEVEPDELGGWRATVVGGPHPEPLRSLLAATSGAADVVSA